MKRKQVNDVIIHFDIQSQLSNLCPYSIICTERNHIILAFCPDECITYMSRIVCGIQSPVTISQLILLNREDDNMLITDNS